MIIESARMAARDLSDPDFRSVLWKSLGLTVVLFVACWVVLEGAVTAFVAPLLVNWPWVTTAISWLLGTGIVLGGGYLLAPAVALFAGFFLDDIAEGVEAKHYRHDEPGKALKFAVSGWLSVKFAIVVIVANLIALLLVLLPGINFAIFFLVNGYLLGREYFTFTSMRFRPERQSNHLRRQHSGTVFLAGMVIVGFMAVPLLNLLTPIFAVSMMVHLNKFIDREHPVGSDSRSSTIPA